MNPTVASVSAVRKGYAYHVHSKMSTSPTTGSSKRLLNVEPRFRRGRDARWVVLVGGGGRRHRRRGSPCAGRGGPAGGELGRVARRMGGKGAIDRVDPPAGEGLHLLARGPGVEKRGGY